MKKLNIGLVCLVAILGLLLWAEKCSDGKEPIYNPTIIIDKSDSFQAVIDKKIDSMGILIKAKETRYVYVKEEAKAVGKKFREIPVTPRENYGDSCEELVVENNQLRTTGIEMDSLYRNSLDSADGVIKEKDVLISTVMVGRDSLRVAFDSLAVVATKCYDAKKPRKPKRGLWAALGGAVVVIAKIIF